MQSEAVRETTRTALKSLLAILTNVEPSLKAAAGLTATAALAFFAQLAQLASLLQGFNVSNADILPTRIDNDLGELTELCRQMAACVGDPNQAERVLAKLNEAKVLIVRTFEYLKDTVKAAIRDKRWKYGGAFVVAGGVGCAVGGAYAAVTGASKCACSLAGGGIGLAIGTASLVQYKREVIRIEQEARTRLHEMQLNLNRMKSYARQLRCSADEEQKREITKLMEEMTDLETTIAGYKP